MKRNLVLRRRALEAERRVLNRQPNAPRDHRDHMKKIIVATVLAAIGSTATLAADLGARAPYTKAPTMMASVSSWTGWYAGLNAGWAGGGDGVSTIGTVSPASTAIPLNAVQMAAGATTSLRGSDVFVGGGQFGYNYQFSPLFVAGIEADIQGLSRSR